MEDAEHLFAAFAVVWTAVFAFIAQLSFKQKRLRREIASLQKKLESIEEEDIV